MNSKKVHTLIALSLRKRAIFPGVVSEIIFTRAESVRRIKGILKNTLPTSVLLLTQKKPSFKIPSQIEDFYKEACLTEIKDISPLGEGYKLTLIGVQRAKVFEIKKEKEELFASFEIIADIHGKGDNHQSKLRQTCHLIKNRFEELNELLEILPEERFLEVVDLNNVAYDSILDRIAYIAPISTSKKTRLLGEPNVLKRAKLLLNAIEKEIVKFQEVRSLHAKTRNRMEKIQHHAFLREQLRTIQSQLKEEDFDGEGDGDGLLKLKNRIRVCKAPQEVLSKLEEELGKLSRIPSYNPESGVCRTYIETILDLPWQKRGKLSLDLKHAQKILDEDHYGLKDIKETIIEIMAVQTLSKKPSRSILCLVGPPGVGKTSVAASIARATKRNYKRIALGGLHDEAELRGHRRTYIGSMPGRIIQSLRSSKVCNPLILFDEIDKMGHDFRGDPSAAMLEILDPEQNQYFQDNFLEIPFDLSEVLFVCTANNYSDIPEALRDRMETIHLSGYLGEEKIQIAKSHLIPKQVKLSGLLPKDITISSDALKEIISGYTFEAGVRDLERQITKICRKKARNKVEKEKNWRKEVQDENLEALLGPRTHHLESQAKYLRDSIGQVNALAWTRMGGEILRIEVVSVPGKGLLKDTGQLGKVMRESAQAAWTCVRSKLLEKDSGNNMKSNEFRFIESHDFHLHVLDGATPKDGPSAGCALATALISSILKVKVKGTVAMTGELSLNGEVLPIGGLKEKAYAAVQTGVKVLIFPKDNLPQWRKLPKFLREKIQGVPCVHIDEVWSYALENHKKISKNA